MFDTELVRLLRHLRPGISVLDVGCGEGTVTRQIAERVGPESQVVGVDIQLKKIQQARSSHHLSNLSFDLLDVYALPYREEFDLVIARKLFLWLKDPWKALEAMVRATVSGGKVFVVDIARQHITWQPDLPESVRVFHEACRQWRISQGFDDGMGEALPGLFRKVGLVEILAALQVDRLERTNPLFFSKGQLWFPNLSKLTQEVIDDGFLTEAQLSRARCDYHSWLEGEGQEIASRFLVVEGTKPF